MHLYVDIGIGAILIIALIVGIIKGFVKQFTGGFCGLIALIGSIGLTIIIMSAISGDGTLNGFAASAAGWFTGGEFVAPINSYEELLSTLSSSGFLSVLKSESISERIWATMSQSQMSTLGEYFGSMCARLIASIVLWIVLLLVIKLIFFFIRKGLVKLSTLPVLHTLDKIFGAFWGLLIAYVILVVFIVTAVEIVFVKWMPAEMLETLQNIVANSKLFQILHETNVIGAYVARLVDVDLATLTPII